MVLLSNVNGGPVMTTFLIAERPIAQRAAFEGRAAFWTNLWDRQ